MIGSAAEEGRARALVKKEYGVRVLCSNRLRFDRSRSGAHEDAERNGSCEPCKRCCGARGCSEGMPVKEGSERLLGCAYSPNLLGAELGHAL
jgi:hypothetical protein